MRSQPINSFILGIDGGSGSGKTTYALTLQQQLEGSMIFHLDDFIQKKNDRYNEDYEEWYCYYHLQWRYDYLIRKLLQPLKNGYSLNDTLEFYDKVTDSYVLRQIEVPAGTTVIVEGVFLQRPELRSYFNKVIYLDVDRKQRLKRVLERDTYIGSTEEITLKYERRYFAAEEVYLQMCNPHKQADEIQFDVKGSF